MAKEQKLSVVFGEGEAQLEQTQKRNIKNFQNSKNFRFLSSHSTSHSTTHLCNNQKVHEPFLFQLHLNCKNLQYFNVKNVNGSIHLTTKIYSLLFYIRYKNLIAMSENKIGCFLVRIL
jgi:hypothetical protein